MFCFLVSSGWSLGIQRDCVCGVELFAGFLQCQGACEGGDQAQPRTRRRERTRDCRWSSGSGCAGLRWTRLHGRLLFFSFDFSNRPGILETVHRRDFYYSNKIFEKICGLEFSFEKQDLGLRNLKRKKKGLQS